MLTYNITESHIKKDHWIKEVRKTFNPELLADLIKKRIEFPNTTGPYIKHNSDELPTDIIDALIAHNEENRKKLTPAVGLLLFRLIHNKMPENHEILRGVFSIIRESKLVECEHLVYGWLQKTYKVAFEVNKNDSKWRATYLSGMMAYAKIQSKDKDIEDWWYNIWRDNAPAWWPAAFLGLRIQNPDIAVAELPLLISRNMDKLSYLLLGMWSDLDCRPRFELAIRKGIDSNTGWAGFALNTLLEKLTEADKNNLMLNLKALGKNIEVS
jgi:hypothetical protein